MLSLALALGRRRKAMWNLRVADIDRKRNEVRVNWEKGKPGRVFPVAPWAMNVAHEYVEKARPLLVKKDGEDNGWLFVGQRTERVCGEYLGRLLRSIQRFAAEENPDLVELPNKKLKTHSLRTTFATLLFFNGASIRSVNELLMHQNLATTAMYTPLGLDDVRQALRLSHPRA